MPPFLNEMPAAGEGGGSSAYLQKERDRLKQSGALQSRPSAGNPNRPSAGDDGSSSSDEPFVVFTSKDKKKTVLSDPITGAPRPFHTPTTETEVTRTRAHPDQVLAQFDAAPAKRKKSLARRLAKAGLIPVEPRMGESLDAYMQRVTMKDIRAGFAAAITQAATAAKLDPNTPLSPLKVIDRAVEFNRGILWGDNGAPGSALQPAGSSSSGGKGGSSSTGAPQRKPGKTYTETSKRVDIYNQRDAEGLARAALENELGRVPTEDEYADFVSTLNAESRANPTTTVTKSVYDKFGTIKDQRTRTRGGLSESGINAMATEWAEAQPGAAEWQAIGTYFPALLNALGSVVPGV